MNTTSAATGSGGRVSTTGRSALERVSTVGIPALATSLAWEAAAAVAVGTNVGAARSRRRGSDSRRRRRRDAEGWRGQRRLRWRRRRRRARPFERLDLGQQAEACGLGLAAPCRRALERAASGRRVAGQQLRACERQVRVIAADPVRAVGEQIAAGRGALADRALEVLDRPGRVLPSERLQPLLVGVVPLVGRRRPGEREDAQEQRQDETAAHAAPRASQAQHHVLKSRSSAPPGASERLILRGAGPA